MYKLNDQFVSTLGRNRVIVSSQIFSTLVVISYQLFHIKLSYCLKRNLFFYVFLNLNIIFSNLHCPNLLYVKLALENFCATWEIFWIILRLLVPTAVLIS